MGPVLPSSPFEPSIDFCSLCTGTPARVGGNFDRTRLLAANVCFMSAVHDGRRVDTPRCFHTLSILLGSVTPALRGRIRHLTQQDIGDLIFSLSREYARRDFNVCRFESTFA
jgi:hypothetical protein